MTADRYVEAVLAKYRVPRGPSSPAESLGSAVGGPLRSWANQYLNALEHSGSYATGTGARGISDVDVFVASILRGKTAGQDYKKYILPLMFYKRLCDQWECEADDAIADLEARDFPERDALYKWGSPVPDDFDLNRELE